MEESVRDVVFMWKDGGTSFEAAPGPDFKAMDRSAARAGRTTSRGFREHRSERPALLRTGTASLLGTRAALPSDRDPHHTYGCPSSYKPLEEYRRTGDDCSMQDLIQGKFQYEWVGGTAGPGGAFGPGPQYRATLHKPTLAQMGHQKGAALRRARLEAGGAGPGAGSPSASVFKMSKFANVPSKVKGLMRPPAAVVAAARVPTPAGSAAAGDEAAAAE